MRIYKDFLKRVLDVLLSGSAMVCLSPLFLLVGWKIKKNLGSPVLFTQYRPGKDRRIFKMYKFRSMTEERDAAGRLLPDSVRLNEFGRKLRASSLDELPELINIFKGDMSIVGPRPQLVRDMVFFDERQMKRQLIYPGLTGLAQVSGRNHITWEEKIQYDLRYMEDINFLEDLRIIYRTVFKVAGQEDIAAEGMDTAEDLGDYLLRTGKITRREYEEKQLEAQKLLEVEA